MKRRLFQALALCLIAPALASAQSEDDARIREAATRGVAAIQKAQSNWFTSYKQVCASCHHQYQPALAYRAARERGITVDETIARADAVKAFTFADIDRAIQYSYVIEPAMDDAYRMVAAHAAGVPPNLGAAVYARLLISRQNRDGDWDGFHQRPPSSYSRFTMAALGLRAVQIYHHASQKAAAAAAVARARKFLETREAKATEEQAYRLIGLKWAGADRASLQRLARELKAAQRADGGWGAVGGGTCGSRARGGGGAVAQDGHADGGVVARSEVSFSAVGWTRSKPYVVKTGGHHAAGIHGTRREPAHAGRVEQDADGGD